MRMRRRRQSLTHVLTLRIAPSTHETLERHADVDDISVAELIRRLIHTHLEGTGNGNTEN